MARRAVARPFCEVRKLPLVPHDRYDRDRFTGVWGLSWRVPSEHPVSIGSGRFRLDAREDLIGAVVRGARGAPVLPGASLKGAMRQVFEFLTPACDPTARGAPRPACQVRQSDDHPRVCPACSLFGAPGYAGRLAVTEALPPTPTAARVDVRRAPRPWEPRSEVEGTLRVYDRSPAQDTGRDGRTLGPAPGVEQHESVVGEFRGRLRFVNASEEELALLLLASGVAATQAGPAGSVAKPGLKVGGKKFTGWGEVYVDLLAVHLRAPEERSITGAEAVAAWWRPLFQRRVEQGDPKRLGGWRDLLAAWTGP